MNPEARIQTVAVGTAKPETQSQHYEFRTVKPELLPQNSEVRTVAAGTMIGWKETREGIEAEREDAPVNLRIRGSKKECPTSRNACLYLSSLSVWDDDNQVYPCNCETPRLLFFNIILGPFVVVL